VRSAAAGRQPGEQPSREAAGGGVDRLREMIVVGQATTRGMIEAEEALDLVRQRFERTRDADTRGDLAVQALEQVERQLELTRERRRLLDGVEGTLWSRRNRLERFLIHARGAVWWQEHRGRHGNVQRDDGAPWNA
jgi:hypothetical protein